MLFKIKDSTIELKDDSALINNKTVAQQEKNLQALSLFIQSNNQVVSKETLMKALWGDMIVSDDSLFKVIQELRKLFKTHGVDGKIIVNVYGKGYKVLPTITEIFSEEIQQLNNTKQNLTSETKYKEVLERNNKPKILLGLLLLVVSIGFSAYLYTNSTKESINKSEFEDYKKLVYSDPIAMDKILKSNYSDGTFTQNDQIKINYLQGYVFYKGGDYKQAKQHFEKAISISEKISPTNAAADTYYILSWITAYSNNPELMEKYLHKAESFYTLLSNEKGLIKTSILRGRYYIVIDDYDAAETIFSKILKKSLTKKDLKVTFSAYFNLTEAYSLQGKQDKAIENTKAALNLALDAGDAQSISYAYGFLSSQSMRQGKFEDAMKQAHKTIRYAIEKDDINLFQQSFSYLYNILSVFGHDVDAKRYLTIAINLQNQLNSDGHLTEAEINLGVLNIKMQDYDKAQQIFEKILTYPLNNKETINLTTAWLALTRFYQKDNIAAYSLGLEIFNNIDADDTSKLVSGIALIFSGFELERINESLHVFERLKLIEKQNLLIENAFFLEMAMNIHENTNPEQYAYYLQEQEKFSLRIHDIKLKTTPDPSLYKHLDSYFEKVLDQ